MPYDPPVQLSLDEYVAFLVFLAVVIGLLFWWLRRRERQTRDLFFSQFDPQDLRMSPFRIGLVYRVVSSTGDGVIVVPIWDEDRPVDAPKEISLSEEALVPFDRNRFS